MRPLHECRGKLTGSSVTVHMMTAFNEAPARMQGKTRADARPGGALMALQ